MYENWTFGRIRWCVKCLSIDTRDWIIIADMLDVVRQTVCYSKTVFDQWGCWFYNPCFKIHALTVGSQKILVPCLPWHHMSHHLYKIIKTIHVFYRYIKCLIMSIVSQNYFIHCWNEGFIVWRPWKHNVT